MSSHWTITTKALQLPLWTITVTVTITIIAIVIIRTEIIITAIRKSRERATVHCRRPVRRKKVRWPCKNNFSPQKVNGNIFEGVSRWRSMGFCFWIGLLYIFNTKTSSFCSCSGVYWLFLLLSRKNVGIFFGPDLKGRAVVFFILLFIEDFYSVSVVDFGLRVHCVARRNLLPVKNTDN